MNVTDIPSFGDLVENKALDGKKIKLEDVLDKPIIITGFRTSKSKFAKKGTEMYTRIQFYFEDDEKQERHVVFTGSTVIPDQLKEIEGKLEESGMELIFRTTIKEIGNYFSLT